MSLLTITYNDKAKDDALEKCHLLPFLTFKKHQCFTFSLLVAKDSIDNQRNEVLGSLAKIQKILHTKRKGEEWELACN